LMDQLPQMASAVPPLGLGQAMQSQSSIPHMDGFQWGGWTDPQDMPMNWLPPPAEDQLDHAWPAWPCDVPADLVSAWSSPPEFFETPQKMQHRLPDEWTPPKPDYSMGLQELMPPELWPHWEPTMDCVTHGYSVPAAPTEIPPVPPLPVGTGTSSPPSTPRQKKALNPSASPTPLKTPNTRVAVRVPRSAGGQTSLPATPHNRWVQETPSPQRTYLAQPINRLPFGEIPPSIFPLPETEPPPWT